MLHCIIHVIFIKIKRTLQTLYLLVFASIPSCPIINNKSYKGFILRGDRAEANAEESDLHNWNCNFLIKITCIIQSSG